jgi:hypothetical protein
MTKVIGPMRYFLMHIGAEESGFSFVTKLRVESETEKSESFIDPIPIENGMLEATLHTILKNQAIRDSKLQKWSVFRIFELDEAEFHLLDYFGNMLESHLLEMGYPNVKLGEDET